MESLYISDRTHVSHPKPVFLNLCGTADPLLKIVSFDLIEYEVTKLYYLERMAFFVVVFTPLRSLVSSGSIVSDYGLDDRAIGVRSPAGAKDFFSLSSVSRPALVPTQPLQWVPWVLSPGQSAAGTCR
jgi:hypothetical protein